MLTPRMLLSARHRVFYGWWMVFAAFFTQILQSSMLFLSQGLYLVALQGAFGWSRGTISWAFSLIRAESGAVGPLQGWLVDRFGPRPVMLAGNVFLGIGLILFSRINGLWQLYLVFGLMALGASLAGFLTINTGIAHWFVQRRTRAMSLTSVGFASGGIIIPLIGWAIVALGWRETVVICGIAVLLVGVPASLVFRRSPEDFGLLPDGGAARLDKADDSRPALFRTEADFTIQEAVRDRSFWFIAIGHGMALMAVATMPVHLVPYLVDDNGWNATRVALLFTLITVMQMVGQIGGGFLGDLYSKRIIAALAMFGHSSAFIILALTASPAPVIAAVALHGLGWGMRGPLMMAIRAEYFGPRNMGVITGWSNTITQIGSIVGPVFAGIMYDALGSYRVPFLIIGIATGISMVFFLMARRPPAPKRLRQEQPQGSLA